MEVHTPITNALTVLILCISPIALVTVFTPLFKNTIVATGKRVEAIKNTVWIRQDLVMILRRIGLWVVRNTAISNSSPPAAHPTRSGPKHLRPNKTPNQTK